MVTKIAKPFSIRPKMDRLTDFLQRFDLQARVVHNGPLGPRFRVEASEGTGRLHLVRAGSLLTGGDGEDPAEIAEPSLLFYPRATRHELRTRAQRPADCLSATVAFGVGDENPILKGLPRRLLLPLRDVPNLDPLVGLLMDESLERHCGYTAIVDRLVEVLVVKLLRLAIERKMMDRGVVAGLADVRLAKTLTALHAAPQTPWTLDLMAQEAGMSRSRFAAHFTTVMDVSGAEYLKQWRVGLAKRLLREGRPIKHVALEVGYGSSASFGRAFAQVEGITPSGWLQRQQG